MLMMIVCMVPFAGSTQDVLKTQGQKILSEFAGSVLPVEIVSKIRMNMEGRSLEPQERTTTALATVVDESGLLLLSNSAINPENIYKSFFGGYGKVELSSEVSSIRIRQDDGKEIDAEVVLRDKDLDIALIRPQKKEDEGEGTHSWKAVQLEAKATLKPLDEIFILERLGRSMNWAPAIRVDRIKAVIERPRLLFLPSSTMLEGQLGTPVFTKDGHCAGILLLKLTTLQRSAGMDVDFLLTGFQFGGLTKVVLPAKHILRIIQEAKKGKE